MYYNFAQMIMSKIYRERIPTIYILPYNMSYAACKAWRQSLAFSIFFFFSCPQMSAQGGTWQKDAADQNFDYMFKLLIIGNSSVGKTSFLFRYADDSFTSAFVSTVGIDFKVKTVFRQDKRVKLQIWVSEFVKKILTVKSIWVFWEYLSLFQSNMTLLKSKFRVYLSF